MQNKPNLCRFWAKNEDFKQKRTQNEPNSNPISAKNDGANNEKTAIFFKKSRL